MIGYRSSSTWLKIYNNRFAWFSEGGAVVYMGRLFQNELYINNFRRQSDIFSLIMFATIILGSRRI